MMLLVHRPRPLPASAGTRTRAWSHLMTGHGVSAGQRGPRAMREARRSSALLGFRLGSPCFHGKMVRGVNFLAVVGYNLAARFIVIGAADVVGNSGVEGVVRIGTEWDARKAALLDRRRGGTDGFALDGLLMGVGATTWQWAWVSAHWWVRRVRALVHTDIVVRSNWCWYVLVTARASALRMLWKRWLMWGNWGVVTRILLVVVSNLRVYGVSVSF